MRRMNGSQHAKQRHYYSLAMATNNDLAAVQLPEVEHRLRKRKPIQLETTAAILNAQGRMMSQNIVLGVSPQ